MTKFIEKPNTKLAKKIIKKNAYWNSGILFAQKISIINNFKKYQNKTLNLCIDSVYKSKISKNIYYLNEKSFKKVNEISFDYAVLEKSKNVNAIKLNIPWSDLGDWKEISNIFLKNKSKYIKKNKVFHRPWGKYTNLFKKKLLEINNIKIACEPQMNIICFRYGIRDKNINENDIINLDLQKFLLDKHNIFFSIVEYNNFKWLRAVLLNPFFNSKHIKKICSSIREFTNEKKIIKLKKLND